MSRAIVLGSPPEFGKDGSPPPVWSQAVVVSTKTFVVDGDTLDSSHIPPTTTRVSTGKSGGGRAGTMAGATGAMAGAVVLGPVGFVVGAGLLAAAAGRKRHHRRNGSKRGPEHEPEVRMLIYSQLWQRDDPIVQLPPGAAQEKSYTVTTGIEQAHTRELARSLGLKTCDAVALSASLATRFSTQVTLKAQESHTVTLRLQNDGAERYRLFARWSVIHRLEVVSVRRGGPPVAILRSSRERARGQRMVLASVEIPDSNSANLTAVDVDPTND